MKTINAQASRPIYIITGRRGKDKIKMDTPERVNNQSPKPTPIKPNPSRIPANLKEDYLFCCWRYEWRGERWTKVPYNPRNGYHASTNKPDTFTDFNTAVNVLDNYDGLGVLMTDHLAGIDIDHCIERDGNLSPLAYNIITTMLSYTETSPSGKGIRILFTVPAGYQYDAVKYYVVNRELGPTEVHVAGSENRFLTLTGAVQYESEIEERPVQLQAVLDKYMLRPETPNKNTAPPEPVSLDDQEIIDKAKNTDNVFKSLWDGNISGYNNDHSIADLALCEKLAFWTGRDPDRIDRLFRSSGLMRDKWIRVDYRRNTINKACDYCNEVYTPTKAEDITEKTERPEAKKTDTGPGDSSSKKARTVYEETGEQVPEFKVYDVASYINNKMFENDIEYFKRYKDRKMGFYSIDQKLVLYPGLGSIGGASSLGKTTFCINVSDNLVFNGETVLYFSFEQEPIELVTKSLARQLQRIDPATRLRNIGIKNGQQDTAGHLEQAKKEYAKTIGDRFKIVRCDFRTTASSICDYIDDYIKTTGRRPIVFIDYLQLVAPPADWRGDTRGAIDDNIKLFKTMQLRNELLVILVSNFNRSGYDSPVSYSDFKETGMIEYTCDYLWGLQLEILDHREYYVAEGQGSGGKDRLTTPQEKDELIDRAISQYPKKVQFVSLKSRNGTQRYKCNLDYYMDLDYFNDPSDPEQLKQRNPF